MRLAQLLFGILILCSSFSLKTDDDQLLNRLDELLEQRESYFEKRKSDIRTINQLLVIEKDPVREYELIKRITQKYLPYNADSALLYSRRGVRLASTFKNENTTIESNLLLAQAYILVGLYHESVAILDQYEGVELPPQFQAYFYSINAVLYNTLSSLRITSSIRMKYRHKWEGYERNLMDALPENDLGHHLAKAELYKEIGRLDEAITILENILEGVKIEDRVYASTAYTLADAYGRKGLIDKKIDFLTLSSQSDILNGVKEHTSLRELALELYKNNELSRAYHYIKVALDDAVESNAQLRRAEVLEILPLIDHSYQENREKVRKYIMIFSTIVCVLLIILIFGMIFIQKQKKELEASNTQVKETNQLLSQLNDELKNSKQEVENANKQLMSVNNIQEESIARYLKLCSTYIGKLDDYRKQLLRKGNKSNKEDLLTILKSKEIVDQELKIFYKDFDQSFLKLYPNFVESYNDLMIEGAQITLKKNELLNTELRVFALVRLGIEESTQIAEFLRYSITTIYNYRTKARNNAKAGRENFEKLLMNIH
ncbi:DUF6377 domain-containing protein [Flammeovirga sp. EKP202]|uniref:DUF6377 domain-containing protein n=1 Tax=Flammeovirga sp. EKP202 TaxID=2770592 RepID=UPI00165FCE00|nr:DUF6377 domain-containing protein [Flammeovirga sp. EKP202]MBD0400315.1 hypothetical protein [Flammeovirga sp. EKP202]